MLRFVLGIVAGALLSIAYVRFDAAPLKFMGLPGDLAGNVVSTATESVLYDLDANAAARSRSSSPTVLRTPPASIPKPGIRYYMRSTESASPARRGSSSANGRATTRRSRNLRCGRRWSANTAARTATP